MRALLLSIASVVLAGCSPLILTECRPSAELIRRDAAACAAAGDRLCVGVVWLRVKCPI